ncbi:protein pleiotropic regulatory locus 1-like [Camellia sinensis]|uniref:protein pleiotropic regulatory locus 1-like n=1 Tax=Camellia sinensis TaxID=4442 RepID=UPI001036B658|nr:protein pleiotropic regulatory locus 1-like [Camellia sinensis]
MTTLTHHKKFVRVMALHPKENCFASASADNIKKFNLPKGEFMHNILSRQKTIINAMAVNEDGVMATRGGNPVASKRVRSNTSSKDVHSFDFKEIDNLPTQKFEKKLSPLVPPSQENCNVLVPLR